MRIGYGYDVHRLEVGEKLILGGVHIPFEKGLLGHSDADVLIHALIDAILGALALGDIGTLFPDSDNRFKNIDSRKLLKKVYDLMISCIPPMSRRRRFPSFFPWKMPWMEFLSPGFAQRISILSTSSLSHVMRNR